MKKPIVPILIALVVAGFFANRAIRESSFFPSYHTIQPDSPEALLLAEQQAKEVRYASGFARPEAPDEFLRYHAEIRTREGAEAPEYPMNYKMAETNKAVQRKALSLMKTTILPWNERGPGNIGGRTRGLIVDPDDQFKNTWYAGSVGGGVWKTTDGGLSWINKTPNLPNLATTCLAMAMSNHHTIYLGTGEGFGNIDAIRGDGIWKSTDRGENWSQLASTTRNTSFAYVNRIIVSPSDENILVVATNTGIFRSVDGGSSWTTSYTSSGRIQQVIASPQDFNLQYATRNSLGVLRSTDAGVSWFVSSSGLGAGARYELAIAPTNANRLYAGVETSSSVSDLYVSDDGGATWSKTTQAGTSPNWLNGQGWYDNTIAVHPYNQDVVFVGGLDLYRINVGGAGASTSQILGVDTLNTRSFLSFVNFGLPFMGGGVGSGDDFVPPPVSTSSTDYVSVEIRFGPGRSQKAHRFTPPDGAGQPISAYAYAGYVDVPFEVWDVTNSRQLMVSFRDQTNNGVFDLSPTPSGGTSREYVFVNAVPYSASSANPNVAIAGGFKYKNIYGMGPALAAGATWNPSALPNATLRINYGTVTSRTRTSTKITDWRTGQSTPYVHADHHNITIIPIDNASQLFRILDASDGGIGFSFDGGATWSNPNNGYNTSQFYGADKKPGEDVYIGGMQDNGTSMSPSGSVASSLWRAQLGGDGFSVSWNYQNPNKIIGAIQYNSFRRTTNGGLNWISGTTDMVDVGSGFGPFISVVAKSNSDPDLLFTLGSRGVWRSDNFAENWTLCAISTEWGFGTGSKAAISIADPQIVWAGSRMSNSTTTPGKLFVSTDGGVTFSPTTNYTGATLGRFSGLATHPTQPQTCYALFSIAQAPKVLRTTNLGQTWTDLSGFGSGAPSSNGFPDVATYSLLVMPHNPNEIWVGTEIGLFISTDNGGTWTYANDALPAVAIWQLSVVDDQVVAATHGRGVWSVTIPQLLNAPPPVVTWAPRLNKSQQTTGGIFPISLSLRSPYDSTVVFVDGNRFTAIPANDAASDLTVSYPVSQSTPITIGATSYKNGKAYKSSTRTFSVMVSVQQEKRTPTSFSLKQNYPNPFNPRTSFEFDLPISEVVSLKVFDLSGREVATLVDGKRAPGVHVVSWDAADVSSGVYLYRMQAGTFLQTGKMVLTK